MKTTDYNSSSIDYNELADLKAISNVSLSDIQSDDSALLLIFPHSLQEYDRDLGRKMICQVTNDDKTLVTNSIVGFVGKNNTVLTIHSRFSNGEKDYFLHYMIHKIFAANILNLDHTTDKDSVFNFLIYLFPFFLKKSIRQGIYKNYVTQSYNDTNLKGVVDVSRHIHNNIPFNGRIAYSKRNYSYDNVVTQLIRHTIEYLKRSQQGIDIINSDDETKQAVYAIIDATPSYVSQNERNIINKNLKTISHPFYSEYTSLQRLCLQILRHEEIKYGDNTDKVFGVLIDAAWLWEEYLSIIISSKFNHYKKDRGKRFYLFENFQQIIPDYLSFDKRTVADAKYIPLNNQKYYGEEKSSAIYYKTITYMYRFCSNQGYLLYPHPDTVSMPEYYKIKSEEEGVNGGYIVKLGLRIPDASKCRNFSEFTVLMKKYEDEFVSQLPS